MFETSIILLRPNLWQNKYCSWNCIPGTTNTCTNRWLFIDIFLIIASLIHMLFSDVHVTGLHLRGRPGWIRLHNLELFVQFVRKDNLTYLSLRSARKMQPIKKPTMYNDKAMEIFHLPPQLFKSHYTKNQHNIASKSYVAVLFISTFLEAGFFMYRSGIRWTFEICCDHYVISIFCWFL